MAKQRYRPEAWPLNMRLDIDASSQPGGPGQVLQEQGKDPRKNTFPFSGIFSPRADLRKTTGISDSNGIREGRTWGDRALKWEGILARPPRGEPSPDRIQISPGGIIGYTEGRIL